MEVREPSAKYLARSAKQRTEIGVLPLDWKLCQLGEITKLMTNGFVGTATKHYAPNEAGAIYIQGFNVEANAFNLSGVKYVTEAFHLAHQKSCLREGDLLTVQTGDVGLTTVVPPSLVGANCHALIISRLDRAVAEPRYVSQYLNCAQGRARLKLIETGTTMKHLNVGDMLGFVVPQPPIVEQREIAQSLTDADALIDSLEQLLTKKRQIKQGAMQELLTGKRRLPGFKDPWVPRSMADLFDFSGGLSASRDQLGDTGPCYLHYGDIHLSHKTHIDLDAEHHQMPRLDVDLRKVSSSALLRNGDVVFVDASEDDQGVSKHVVVHSREAQPLISGLHTIVARPKSDELVDLYKRYYFQAPPVQAQFRFYAVGTKVSGVSKGNIGKIMLNVPLPVEQKEIAACLAEMDAEIYALESRLTKARALKQAMAQALLTGKIRLI